MGQGTLALVSICFKLSRPNIKLFLGRTKSERTNLSERDASLTEGINHPSVSQLVRGVEPIPRSRVYRCRS